MDVARRRKLVTAIMVSSIAAMVDAPAATAATPVKCAELPALFGDGTGKAEPGEVAQLEPGTCKANVEARNPSPFTLEGASNGTSTLEPADSSLPIIAGDVFDATITDVKLTGDTDSVALDLRAPTAVTLTDDAFTRDGPLAFGEGGAVFILARSRRRLSTMCSPTIAPGALAAQSPSTVLVRRWLGTLL